MPEYRRSFAPGGTFFFTVNAYRRQPLLINQTVRLELRAGIQKIRTKKPFHIDAWVLLPDHLHCIWKLPEGDGDFSSRWAMINKPILWCIGESERWCECIETTSKGKPDLATAILGTQDP